MEMGKPRKMIEWSGISHNFQFLLIHRL